MFALKFSPLHFLQAFALFLVLSCPAVAGSVEDVFDALPGASESAQVRLLVDNHDAWYARAYLIEHAEKSIDCTYFTISSDLLGQAFLGLLLKRAVDGIPIRLMIDDRGSVGISHSFKFSKYLRALAGFPNVKIAIYNPIASSLIHLPFGLLNGLASLHSKLLIIDGQWVVVGGRNIQTRWYARPEDERFAYHDADVLMHGNSVGAQATLAFTEEFTSVRNGSPKPLTGPAAQAPMKEMDTAASKLRDVMTGVLTVPPAPGTPLPEKLLKGLMPFKSMTRFREFKPFATPTSLPTVLLGKHSVANPSESELTPTLLRLIAACKKELTIAHAYMVLTEKVRKALKEASDRGVQINYITNSPESSASMLTQAMFVREWKDYLHQIPKLRIFALADKHKLHGKVIVFDSRVVALGSYNMDPMSERINGEDLVVLKSADFANEALAWVRDIQQDQGLEYKIRVDPDGTVHQVVGPSDHCSRLSMLIMRVLGTTLRWLRPVI
jgi:putative cardiolipin synthase